MMKNKVYPPIATIDVLRYYVAYKDIEQPIIEAVKSYNKRVWAKPFARYMNNYMRIGRNFRGRTDAMVFHCVKNYLAEGGSNVNELSDRFFRNELLSGNNTRALVAASKLLWLFDHGVIIMDNNNRQLLGTPENDYDRYVDAWKTLYRLKEPEIIAVVKQQVLDKIDPVINEEWFRMRVFDQYLWTVWDRNKIQTTS